jgi:hypothetical protein
MVIDVATALVGVYAMDVAKVGYWSSYLLD